MKSRTLIGIEEVVDDETGIWVVGELDFSLYGALDDYLEHHGREGLKSLQEIWKDVMRIAEDNLKQKSR